MSYDEERAGGVRFQNQRDRAPRHWLDPFVGPSFILMLSTAESVTESAD